MEKNYDDIIEFPHHVSKTHPQMSHYDRAAQFSAFAALKGYDDEIAEEGRLTDEWVEPSEENTSVINERLVLLKGLAKAHPEIVVTFFKPDAKKSGGKYVTVRGNLRKFDEYERFLTVEGEMIPFEDIAGIELAEKA